jgi:hypothetical protein
MYQQLISNHWLLLFRRRRAGFEVTTLNGRPGWTSSGMFWRGGRDSKLPPSMGARGGLVVACSGGEGGIRSYHPQWVPGVD